MEEHFGWIDGVSLRDVIRDTNAKGCASHHWLFVALDSLRGDSLSTNRETILDRFLANQVKASWHEGIWIAAADLPMAVERGLIVPFSAAYLFHAGVPRFTTEFKYTLTSESEQFQSEVPQSLRLEMEQMRACAYLSDGVGLNYSVVCSDLWQELGLGSGAAGIRSL
jgi:hypothetical protein